MYVQLQQKTTISYFIKTENDWTYRPDVKMVTENRKYRVLFE